VQSDFVGEALEGGEPSVAQVGREGMASSKLVVGELAIGQRDAARAPLATKRR
jgi:hypothetical protein